LVCNQEVAGSIPAGSIRGRGYGQEVSSAAPEIDLPRRKAKGDYAEMVVAADLLRRGHKVAFPYGDDWDVDLIVARGNTLQRVQTKYTRSDGQVIEVKCFSASLTNGRVRRVKHYTAESVDWIAVYDATTDACYYVPSSEFSGGRTYLHLRVGLPRNNQRVGIRWAADYMEI
jgi:hypothetical protein